MKNRIEKKENKGKGVNEIMKQDVNERKKVIECLFALMQLRYKN